MYRKIVWIAFSTIQDFRHSLEILEHILHRNQLAHRNQVSLHLRINLLSKEQKISKILTEDLSDRGAGSSRESSFSIGNSSPVWIQITFGKQSLWLKNVPDTNVQITKCTGCSPTWKESKTFSSARISTVIIFRNQSWLWISYYGDHLRLTFFP